ncbi:DNA topoisomerase-1 [Filimonas zeae]|uniref:DNA topoisomerase n=1 Tax=Filimonas zeae TaxID=1737353 RepID=A0A917IVC5_9BACT|nr:DNA topoisomerase IB [Filimonas zeae]MDR6339187.1 DNA topoisomerase-1 [Filimonas zeae]GGH64704.1 DNA topoisomerase I [Filimonas zeae]
MGEAAIRLSHKAILAVHRNYEEAASVVKLVYVNDNLPGIVRVKKGKNFSYLYRDKPLTDEMQLERIRKLAIPPAWENVWICALPNGHIQATGKDTRNRKQYRYHALWQVVRNETKFHHMYEFGKALPALRLQVERDMALPGLSEAKVLATVVSLMERTFIRVGNSEYEKLNGSYGLTTLKDKHVQIHGSEMKFAFTGKKGIDHEITLKNRRLAKAVQQCRDIPGKELFQYYDAEGNRHPVDSGMVNRYIQAATGQDFTAKDFRTWAGSLLALHTLCAAGEALTETEGKRAVNTMLDEVSKKLGNTRTVCKKYYVHPGLIQLYQDKKLQRYLKELDDLEEPDETAGLTGEEEVLMKVLKAINRGNGSTEEKLKVKSKN